MVTNTVPSAPEPWQRKHALRVWQTRWQQVCNFLYIWHAWWRNNPKLGHRWEGSTTVVHTVVWWNVVIWCTRWNTRLWLA